MIKLKDINKTYVSKSKQRVDALKNITLEMENRGMIFILGKSGSGKSTLLNILGGIDSATSGEIVVDEISMADFKQADYDNYRNQYVGFVFQEYNLLNDFNVCGNVSLALQLSKELNITEKVTEALLEVGLSAAYLTRKINELSGGEKQRIAIARAIVKNSRMILADEPTGNLDSATGESIWDILKNLSKSKLVVVVTHDRESAERYGDRIIEIADGEVLSDSGEQPPSAEEKQEYLLNKHRLSNRVCFSMGVNNLLMHKGKAVSAILLSIFTIFALVLAQLMTTFSSEKAFARFIDKYGIDYIVLDQGKLIFGNEFSANKILKPSTLKYIADNSACIQNGWVESKQDILDMGLTFVGDALEIDDHSYYLTTSSLEKAYSDKDSAVEIDGVSVKLIKERHPVEMIVGKKVDNGSFDSMEYTLAGVVDTSRCNSLIANAFPNLFAMESFEEIRINPLLQNMSREYPEVVLQFGETRYSKKFKSEDIRDLIGASGRILTEHGLQTVDEIELADDEILLTYEMYEKLFSVSPKWSYVNTNLTDVVSLPEHIGQQFEVKFIHYDTDELLVDAGNLKIAGIAFSTNTSLNPDDMLKFATGKNTNRKIDIALKINNAILVQVASIGNLKKFLVDLRQKHEGYIMQVGEDESVDYSNVIYGFEHELYIFKFIFLIIAAILSVILLLFAINLISFSITNRKREIGILSALGTTNRDITKIFLIETFVISCITFIINLAAMLALTFVFNQLFRTELLLRVPMLQIDIFTVITLIVASFGLLLVATLIPIRKIAKLKPIDAIKNL